MEEVLKLTILLLLSATIGSILGRYVGNKSNKQAN